MSKSIRRIPIALDKNPYEVIINNKGLESIGEELLNLNISKGTRILVVTNFDVAKYYGDLVMNSLKKSSFNPNLLLIEAGEDKKNLRTIELIHNAAFKEKLERSSLIIALGGGVVGDMAGFAASTWLRGISVIQVPTTLLAMVDASIGGKTGVNHTGGKNLIGAFHQPKMVLIDPSTLNSLPIREFRAGMAEIIKYGVIGDPELFNLLEKTEQIEDHKKIKSNLLEEIIERSISSKAQIVIKDEHEGGVRATLNYGHTFGHVIETLCGYGKWLHGEAVAIGMNAVGELGIIKNSWDEKDLQRQKALLKKAGLPTKWPKLNSDDIFMTLQGDKKVKNGKIRFILPTGIGSVEISNDVRKDDIEKCLLKLNNLDILGTESQN